MANECVRIWVSNPNFTESKIMSPVSFQQADVLNSFESFYVFERLGTMYDNSKFESLLMQAVKKIKCLKLSSRLLATSSC